jgi:predicted ATPase
LQVLIDEMRTRYALLVLDNLEHLLDAAPEFSELLRACANVKVLATSREPLGLRWEHVFVVPPLGFPIRETYVPSARRRRSRFCSSERRLGMRPSY